MAKKIEFSRPIQPGQTFSTNLPYQAFLTAFHIASHSLLTAPFDMSTPQPSAKNLVMVEINGRKVPLPVGGTPHRTKFRPLMDATGNSVPPAPMIVKHRKINVMPTDSEVKVLFPVSATEAA